MPIIEVAGVGHTYGRGLSARTVLRDLDFTVTEQRIGVIGANGSGKSTFARLLNGLVLPSEGRVLIDGLDTHSHAKSVRRKVGFIFTDPDAQIVMPTVAEDVAFGLRGRGLDRREIANRVDSALLSFGLDEHRDAPAHLLSGGQKQLLALASVLTTQPDTLVMDEPTTLLDLANTRRIADLVASLPQQVLMVTHQLSLLADFDRTLVFHDGAVVFDGPPAEAISHYRKLVT